MSLERFHERQRRNKELVAAFNKFAEQKDVALYEDRTRVEHECGWLRISYRTVDATFCHAVEMPDEDGNYTPHFLDAFVSGRAMPENCISSTGMLSEETKARWNKLREAASKIKPPLAKAA